MEALKGIPEIEAPLLTDRGEARLQKTDIFRRIMWFGFKEDNNWYPLNIDRVNEILAMNREGKKPASLETNVMQEKVPIATLNSDLANMDKRFQDKSRNKKKSKNRNQNNKNTPTQSNPNQKPKNPNQNKGNRPQGNPNQNPRNQNQPRRNNPNQRNNPKGPIQE